ncbi:hypothetical protein B9Z19DRAFT_65530 [Tuber borchii]|uniref:Uncharacterized protein n=1 Tax=Tuber borchii TaxID=42251 RepID=A0A2T6ZSP4_TUBBO|nr:hypothetical protein B9Z19DRAFT_65530 [Tuber borchii]
MESSSFFYYTPDTTSQTKQHGHFLPHPNGHSQQQQQQQQQQQSTSQCDQSLTNSSVPYPSSLVYSRPTSSHLKPPTLQASPTPLLAAGTLSPEALQKQTGLLTPSSPTLLGMDGHNGSDMYFFPSTPTLSCNSVNTPPMSTVTTTPLITSWSLDDGCNGTITPSDIQLPGTPELWKESPPMTPGIARLSDSSNFGSIG